MPIEKGDGFGRDREKDFFESFLERNTVEGEDFIDFKVRWGEFANEAVRILKKIKELEEQSEELIKRKKNGEFVEEMLKQNKAELKRLKKKEMKTYLEIEKIFTRMQGLFSLQKRSMGLIFPPPFDPDPPVQRVITLRDIPYFRDLFTIKYIYEFSDLTEEEQLVLHKRSLDLAKKRRMIRWRLALVVVLAIFLPMIILPIIIIIFR